MWTCAAAVNPVMTLSASLLYVSSHTLEDNPAVPPGVEPFLVLTQYSHIYRAPTSVSGRMALSPNPLHTLQYQQADSPLGINWPAGAGVYSSAKI